MPPKRRPPTQTDKKARPSKLARENDISAEEEAEIKEAFHLFSQEGEEDFASEKEGVLPTEDVRRALIALGLPPNDKEELREILASLDPDDDGVVTYAPFVAVCALKLHSRTAAGQSEEIEAAYRLFTAGSRGPITMAHLRRVARELKEDIGDDQLRDMILEANGGAGAGSGVKLEDFEGVMRRAGVFS
ncbi:MAG: hypothetical protein M1833_006507 [Piccolia ochrophora]|nr:MAG: hypothetical protein M1833_006507 [Piccolia ochrophora]